MATARRQSQHAAAPAAYLFPQSTRSAGRRLAAEAFPSALAPAFLSVMLPLLLAGAMTAQVLAAAVVGGVVAAGAFGTAYANRKIRDYVSVAACVAAVACLAAVLVVPDMRAAAYSVVNALIYAYDETFGAYVALVSTGATVAGSMGFGLALGVLDGLLCFALTRLRSAVPTLVFVFLACSALVRINMGFGVAGCVFGTVGWACHARLVQLYHAYYAVRALLAEAALVAVCAAVVALCLSAVYTPQALVSAAHSSIQSATSKLRYGSDTLPEGDLTAAGAMNDDSDAALEVSFDAPIADDLLLRGFVGANLDGTSWEALDHKAYEGEWSGVMSWLSSQNLSPIRQRAAYDDERVAAGKEPVETAKVSVDTSKANSKYAYVPYTLREMDATSANTSLDGSVRSGYVGDRHYSYSIDNIPTGSVLESTRWLKNVNDGYVQAEAVLNAFAKANYTQISDEDKAAVEKYIFNDDTWDKSAASSKYAVISRVRTMLTTLASYSEDVSVPPADKSFAEWFLGEAREGNSAYFATAAVLAFRSQGIPARYVEGYRASASQLADAAANNNGELELTSKDVHAWVEVYMDGLGWTPVETAPGFFTQKIEADSVISVREAQSNGKGSDVVQSEGVAGQIDQDTPDDGNHDLPLGVFVAQGVLTIVAVLLLLVAGALLQRALRIAKRKKLAASEDQSVSVPALYRYLALVMRTGMRGYDATKPLDGLDGFEDVFTGIDVREYERVVEIHQSYAFGGRGLKPNEMRTLRRFTQRLHAALPKPQGFFARFKRRFIDAL